MATSSPAPTLAPPGLIAQIQPQILDILRHADLSSISAKRVRAQLAQRSDLPPGIDLVAHKRDIDERELKNGDERDVNTRGAQSLTP